MFKKSKLTKLEKISGGQDTSTQPLPGIVLIIFSAIIFIRIIPGQCQLSPGALHQSHAKLEGIKNCTQCHGLGQRISAENCLKCHEALQNRINKDRGLHADPEYARCENCHVEHQGRNFELIWWEKGQENFDHSKTGFFLQGKHANLKCRQCHQAKFLTDKSILNSQSVNSERTFLGLQSECLSCHYDEHRGELGSNCLDCHQFTSWKPAVLFDHTSTAFPLTGKHLQVDCIKCHPLQTDSRNAEDKNFVKFRLNTFRGCISCHRDVHQNQFGKECSTCHNTSGWKNYDRTQFTHEKTRYPLYGRHRLVSCEKCHLPGRPRTDIRFQHCQDCHSDFHQGQFRFRPDQGACESCHDVNGFSPAKFTIEQHNQTKFILEGAHLAIPCTACHQRINTGLSTETIQFKFSTTDCIACHRNPHPGSSAKYFQDQNCQNCHSIEGWLKIKFNHSQTTFPLESGHSRLRCTACHLIKSKSEVIIISLSPYCQDCHRDPHNNQFETILVGGKSITPCHNCHSAKSWLPEKFDHNKYSAFKLEGAHKKLSCNQCHRLVESGEKKFIRYKPIPHTCADCHGTKKAAESEKR